MMVILKAGSKAYKFQSAMMPLYPTVAFIRAVENGVFGDFVFRQTHFSTALINVPVMFSDNDADAYL